jgi:hypothetical protein
MRCSSDEEQEPPDIGTMTDEEVNAQLRQVMSQEEIDGFVKSTKALVRVCIDNRELRAENERLKKSALDDARAECIEGISGLEHVIREQSKEIERLKAQPETFDPIAVRELIAAVDSHVNGFGPERNIHKALAAARASERKS